MKREKEATMNSIRFNTAFLRVAEWISARIERLRQRKLRKLSRNAKRFALLSAFSRPAYPAGRKFVRLKSITFDPEQDLCTYNKSLNAQ